MEKNTKKRYILILLLFFHTVNTYMDRICISAASGDIQADLGISSQMMGYIFGIFALGYALFQIPAGWVADKYGPKRALTWIVTSWSTFTALSGAAWNAISMLIIRFLFGVGEAGAFPGATKAFYRWIPARERGIANGIFHSGARVGAALSLFILPFLIRLAGWRLTFVITGALGLIWVIIWKWWYHDNPRQNRKISEQELDYIESGIAEDALPGGKLALGQILTSSNMLLVMFQYVASNITFFISFTWLLPYLVSQWGKSAEIYAPIPLLFGTFAQWFSGWIATLIYQRFGQVPSRKIPAIAGFMLSAAGLVLIIFMPGNSALAFTMMFSVAVFGVEMTIAPSWSLCMDIGGDRSGVVSATMNMLGNIGSALSAIIFPFFISSVTIPFLVPETGTANSFFIFAAVMNILAVISWFLIRPSVKLGSTKPEVVKRRMIIYIMLLTLITLTVLLLKFLKF
ncbi:MAG TPA: MFS transporter [Bacteroidales bacterium]|nr:MFS transporter [Bacteroidales bacterium]HPF02016.1 MFS transporter [Bacteroidales bacterium]HPJ60810.1 MFS transporter [Bacteroidales bacterium]HPR12568.1 MFS transporter [Bacteroidales bacterium]HRW86781.1 MFS transporter [Bacteroidales bacterium]